jgi:glutamine amidotransferase
VAKPTVVVLDYGSGNVRSAVRALERVGADVTLTSDAEVAAGADGLVVPGVGAFAACMAGLRGVGGPSLVAQRLAGNRPVLGICVGMQVLFDEGVEHGVRTVGFGEWPGVVERLEAPILPHMGWNTVSVPAGSRLFAGLEGERFYFVHSYAARAWGLTTVGALTPPKVTWSEHSGDRFVAAVEDGALSATQFHPEKSGDAGAALLGNWIAGL